MAINTIKGVENADLYINGMLIPQEPNSWEVQPGGKTVSSVYAHGGFMLSKEDYTNNLDTIKVNIAFPSEAVEKKIRKLFQNNEGFNIVRGKESYSNARLQVYPSIKLNEFCAVEFKALTKSI